MKIAVIQICSGLDPKENLKKINYFIKEAKKKIEVDAVFLPEVFYSMSNGKKPTPYLVENENDHFKAIQSIAKENSIYLLGGSAATKVGDEIRNRVYNFSPEGKLLNHYDKIHLFSVSLKSKTKSTVINESDVYSKGRNLVDFNLNGFHFGMTVCFDLRFPELFREYFKRGVNIFSVSSAFTVPTGMAHWKTLLIARAIENQSFIIAADQWGIHNDKVETYGHSMIIDPWGKVIASLGEGEGFITAELDLSLIEKVRGRMNVSQQI